MYAQHGAGITIYGRVGYSWEMGHYGARFFQKRGAFSQIDLHTTPWDDHNEWTLKFEECWKNRQEVHWRETLVPVLSPTDAFLERSAHDSWTFNLFYPNLKGVLDGALLMERQGEEIQWEVIDKVAKTPERRLGTWLYLSICQEFFGLLSWRAKAFHEKLSLELREHVSRFAKDYFILKRIFPRQWCLQKWYLLALRARAASRKDFPHEILSLFNEAIQCHWREVARLPSSFFRDRFATPHSGRLWVLYFRLLFFLRFLPEWFLIWTVFLIKLLFEKESERTTHYGFLD